MKNVLGYLVMESCEDHEQALSIITGGDLPPGGILDWPNGPRAVFATRGEAVAAINRTEHYRIAFGDTNMPEKKYCHPVPLRFTRCTEVKP